MKIDAVIGKALGNIIVDTAKDAAPLGAPSGAVYAALMTIGITLNEYQSLLDTLVAEKRIKVSNHLITAL